MSVVVEATTTSLDITQTTSHTVSLPTGVTEGDLLIIFFSGSNYPQGSVTVPTGWTPLVDETSDENDITGHYGGVWYRTATGTEGSTVSVTSSALKRSAHHAYRISGHDPDTAPEVAYTVDDGEVITTPSAPQLTPSWGSAENLWLASAAGSFTDIDAPTNYTTQLDNRTDVSTNHYHAAQISARRTLEASSETPGSFQNLDWYYEWWITATVAVKPITGEALTLTPDGHVSVSGIEDQSAGTTNLHEAVDDDPDDSDGDTTYLVNSADADGHVWLTLSNTPAGFNGMNALSVRVRARRVVS